jgi:hypothetical protein
MTLTADRLKELLHYDPDTGKWTWLVASGPIRMGQRAGRFNSHGRVQIGVGGRKWVATHLAWLYMTGEWPKSYIDHKNRNKSDDRWENLRLATRSQNMVNFPHLRPKRPDLPRGVTAHQGKYLARISIDGKRKHIGVFETPEAASAAYLKASAFRAEFLPSAPPAGFPLPVSRSLD